MRAGAATLGLALILGCGGAGIDRPAPPLPWPAEPMPSPPADGATPAQVELGRLLFHDPILSRDRKVACVTCHGQIWGLSDGLPRSIGVGGTGPAGTGRTGPHATRRNALTLWNVAWRSAFQWDGRAPSLEAQALLPLADPIELGRAPEEVVADLAAIEGYCVRFAEAWPEDGGAVRVERLVQALAAFQRTLISDDAPYDRYLAGDEAALSRDAVRGMFLFAKKGCAACHAPPRFESDRYEPSALPPCDDGGRAEVTGDPADRHRFRVPTLRNVRDTNPYFHDGSVATLEEAIALEARGASLDADEVAAIATFLRKGLVDRSRLPRRALAVPSGLDVPLDGYQVPR